MGGFVVFGISKSLCREAAAKKTSTEDLLGKRSLTMAEWTAQRDALAEKLFQGTRPVRCSPEFDAPQFALDWLAVDPGHVRLAKVMARGPKLDKSGEKVIRGGVAVQTWVEYTINGVKNGR